LLAEHGVTSEPSHIDKASLARLEMWSGNKRRRWQPMATVKELHTFGL